MSFSVTLSWLLFKARDESTTTRLLMVPQWRERTSLMQENGAFFSIYMHTHVRTFEDGRKQEEKKRLTHSENKRSSFAHMRCIGRERGRERENKLYSFMDQKTSPPQHAKGEEEKKNLSFFFVCAYVCGTSRATFSLLLLAYSLYCLVSLSSLVAAFFLSLSLPGLPSSSSSSSSHYSTETSMYYKYTRDMSQEERERQGGGGEAKKHHTRRYALESID